MIPRIDIRYKNHKVKVDISNILKGIVARSAFNELRVLVEVNL